MNTFVNKMTFSYKIFYNHSLTNYVDACTIALIFDTLIKYRNYMKWLLILIIKFSIPVYIIISFVSVLIDNLHMQLQLS